MASPYVGEIRIFAGNFAPLGWMFCEGQLLPIEEYDTLFNLIGTTYGGDGQSRTFGLPDLRAGRLPITPWQLVARRFSNRNLADNGGVEQVTLTLQQIPIHNHSLLVSGQFCRWKLGLGQMSSRTGGRHADLPGDHPGVRAQRPGYDQRRRQPAARQFSALSLCGFHHLAFWGLPLSNLRSSFFAIFVRKPSSSLTHVRPFRRGRSAS